MEGGEKEKEQKGIMRFVKKLGKGKKLLRKMIALLIIFAMGFVLGAVVFVVKPWLEKGGKEPLLTRADGSFIDDNNVLTIGNVREIVKPASDLVTMKYYYTDADTYENYKELFGKRVPFTTDKVIFTYDGEISLGIELSGLGIDVDNEGKKLTITLPEMEIKSNEIDSSSFEYPYISNSVFNATEMDDYIGLIDKLKQEKEEEVLRNTELMESARENTRSVLRDLLKASDVTKDYEIIFS